MNKARKFLSVLLALIACICLIIAGVLIVQQLNADRHTQEVLDDLRSSAEAIKGSNMYPSATTLPTVTEPPVSTAQAPVTEAPDITATPAVTKKPPETPAPTPQPTDTPTPTQAPLVNPYRDSFLANKDMAAWLVIPGTVIDYPVMWTPKDENYYLYRSFDGGYDVNGSLILDTDSCVDPLSTNLIIHGHNMKSGAMFGDLTEYEKEAYYREHKNIILYTEGVQRNYEVIAVFRSQVYKKSDNVFKYYKFFQADNQDQFDDFYTNIKKLSIYDTGVTAQYGDHFLTLSTCVYHVEQGRFVVVAKEVESGDTYQSLSQ